MNATANHRATLAEEDNTLRQFSRLLIEPARGSKAGKLAPSRQAFPEVDSDTAFGLQLLTLSPESPAAAPEEALAIGVFNQAAHDLRRFHSAINGMERELYLDAYSWITANDFSWPYSFVNVCALLHACPDIMRAELLADASLGWFGHWIRLGERLSRLLHASFIRVFTRSCDANHPKSARSARAFQRL